MQATDLIRRASWLHEVAARVSSRDVATLLESYAQDMLKEAGMASAAQQPARQFSRFA